MSSERDEIAADRDALADVLRRADDAALVRTNFGQLVAGYDERANAILASDWLAERDRRTAAGALIAAADDEEFEATCDHLPWVRLGGHCQCGYLRGMAAEIREVER